MQQSSNSPEVAPDSAPQQTSDQQVAQERRLIRGMSGTFVIRVCNLGLKFLISVLLARLLGAGEFGVFSFALALMLLLVEFAVLGFNRLVVRELSVYRSRQAWDYMQGLLRFARRTTIMISIVLVGASLGVILLTYETTGRPVFLSANQSDYAKVALYTLIISLLVLPLRTLLMLQESAIQGLRHVVASQIPDQILQPFLFIVFISSLYLLGTEARTAQGAMTVHVITTAVALAVSVYLLRKFVPDKAKSAEPAFETRAWMSSAIPFAVGRGFNTLNTQIDALMLGAFTGAEAVALYTVSLRGTQVISMLLISLNTALGPHLAQLYAENRRNDLQRAITRGAQVVLAAALPLTLLLIVWGEQFLAIFGPEFRDAHKTLIILSLGQLVNAATGSVGLLLSMTNQERAATVGNGVSFVLHLILNLLLIPRWGAVGAAAAMSVSVVIANIWQMVIAWRRLRIETTAFRFAKTR